MSARAPASHTNRWAGFTLIEVMVALAVVALAMSALLAALSNSAGNISALRDKTVAEWIALNKIADARLALKSPAVGSTEGDIADCAHGTWHWRQDVSAVAAIPGLLNITVSVRRTGNSVTKPDSTSSPRRGLGGPSSLGAAGPLGSVQNVGASGCIANAEPSGSLGGTPTLGAPGTLGAGASLNASPQLGSRSASPGALGAFGALGGLGANQSAAASGSALASSNAAGALSGAPSSSDQSGGNGSSSNSSSSLTGTWLVTLTGFRGNALAAASGESPDWTGAALHGAPGPNGVNQNGNGINGDGVNGNGSNGGIGANGSLGNSPSLGPGSPSGNGVPGGNQSPFPSQR